MFKGEAYRPYRLRYSKRFLEFLLRFCVAFVQYGSFVYFVFKNIKLMS
ncbi:MAG: hypothetical protein LBH59_11455 [Planctomycetaceae bacterium]|nr:hypothetical protein [Planctomycetaceae bacterium]